MAHNIEIINGVASFAENGKKERAWHGLGKTFDRPMFVEEALKACHADYRVEMRPMIPIVNDMAMFEGLNIKGEEVENNIIKGVMATMRMDTKEVLGIVKANSYCVVQNEDAFKFVDMLCSGMDSNRNDRPVIEACGVLGNGERVFITCKFPENIVINSKNDDIIERYVVFTTSHDGSGAVTCLSCYVRVVCNNTLNYALKNNCGKMVLRHTKNVMSRMDLLNGDNANIAYNAIGCDKAYHEFFKGELERLRSLKITEKQVMEIVAKTALNDKVYDIYKKVGTIDHEDISTRSRNYYNNMLQYIHEGVGQEYLQSGSGLWLINGITSFYQNNENYDDDEEKFKSILNGKVANKVQEAYELVG